jgi:hypothetical protein
MATQTWVNQQGFLTSVPDEYVTSGELATVSGDIMSQMPSQTNVSIDPTLSSGTKIADYVIDGTSGELFAPAGGGSVTFPLEVNGSTNVYEARDGLTSGYANAGKLYLEQQAEEDEEPYIDTVSITPYSVEVREALGEDLWTTRTVVHPGSIQLSDEEDSRTIYPYSISRWNDTYYAVDTSAAYWNSAYNAINDSASYWNDAAGMNEYPISAGPGMSIEDVSGVTVFQTSGTMMDDLIEFNSQDEISGYNGHPVMTVDSEKQWLTHDDTIAHVTNSAQYAFGVNVPVVAQAMGTDETELWSSSALASSAALSEPLTNFDFLEVYTRSSDNGYQAFKYTAVNGPVNLTYFKGNNYPVMIMAQLTFSGSTVSVSRTLGLTYSWGSTTIPSAARANNTDDMKILIKVVGIGRKEN